MCGSGERTTLWARRAARLFTEKTARNGDWRSAVAIGIVQGATFATYGGERAATLEMDFRVRRWGVCSGRAARGNLRDDGRSCGAAPEDRPRYLMGVGRPEQIADYVRRGST